MKSFFEVPLKLCIERASPAKQMTVTKVERDQIYLVPRFSKVVGDASHRPHKWLSENVSYFKSSDGTINDQCQLV